MRIICVCGEEYDRDDPETAAAHDDHEFPDDNEMLPTEFEIVDPRYWEALGALMGGWGSRGRQ